MDKSRRRTQNDGSYADVGTGKDYGKDRVLVVSQDDQPTLTAVWWQRELGSGNLAGSKTFCPRVSNVR